MGLKNLGGVKMKNILLEKGQELHEKLCEISDYIYKNPELGNKEYKAVEVLTSFLKEHNFEIEKELLGIETAFRAIYDSKKEEVINKRDRSQENISDQSLLLFCDTNFINSQIQPIQQPQFRQYLEYTS